MTSLVITITLQPRSDMSEFIEAMVPSGDYNNQSEAIRAALRLLQEQNAASKLNQLRSLIDEGDYSEDHANFSMDKLKRQLNVMPQYRVSKAAAADLLEIGLYTQNKWGMAKRDNSLDAIQDRLINLSEDPLSTLAIRRDDVKQRCFFSSVNRHIIAFRRYKYRIRVIRILYQSMDVIQHV